MHQRQAPSAHGNSFNKGKSLTSEHIPFSSSSSGLALVTHGKSSTSTSSKQSPHTSGHPSTSRVSSPPAQMNPASRDSDSDDDAPLVFRNPKRPAPSPSVQIKDQVPRVQTKDQVLSVQVKEQVKNGLTSVSMADVAVVRRGPGNARQQSSDDDSDEDNRPLAIRMPTKRPHESPMGHRSADMGSDEDDNKPLVLKRAANGPSKPESLQKRPQENSGAKKRPPEEVLRGEAAMKKPKLMPKSSSTSSGLIKPPSSMLSPHVSTPKPPSSMLKSPSSSSKPASSTPKPPSSIPRPPSSTSKPPLSTPRPPSSTEPTSNSVSIASSNSVPKTSSNFPSPKPSATPGNKPSPIPPRPSMDLPKPSSIPLKPSVSSLNALNTNAVKMEIDEDEDDVPLAQRISAPKAAKKVVVVKKNNTSLTNYVAAKKLSDAKKAKLKQQQKIMNKKSKSETDAPGAGGGQKWTTLEHNGVIFPPPYNPHGIKMLYDKKFVTLTPAQEEVATMFAVMRDTDYATKPKFLSNFWSDWRKILGSNHVIQSLEGCDFTPIYEWHMAEKEKKKQMTAEEKKRIKEEKQKQEEKYMWALVDGVKEKVGNFRVEPPGLFRGRGEHPKMGKLKRRIFPEDIVINIGEDATIPECPMEGHRWKEIRNDNTVTWLAYWNDPINSREFKYVFLAASSSLKGQSDREKYEKARTLKDYIEDIRRTYTRNFNSADKTRRQIAVATYLIDQLALRAGNEKDDDEADTVGCCSLKVEHVSLVPPRSLEFDFLGKDSIRYFNTVEVVEPVYQAIGDFKKSKKPGDDLFDQLDTSKLNAHLKNIMPHLTAKVFRTYNASITLDRLLVDTDGQIVPEKIASYQKANKEVAILCNHQRSVSKSHGAQMERLEGKMAELKALLKELNIDLDRARKGKPPLKDADGKPKRNQTTDALSKKIAQTKVKIEKMELDMRIKDDLKTVALGTSKINYMDPRITVAWCKRHEVPIEKVFNKSLLAKFAWAMDVDMDYRF